MTPETVFANRKLSFKKIIMAIWGDVTAVKGLALAGSCVSSTSAYVLLQKLREAVGARREKIMLQDRVEMASTSAVACARQTRGSTARMVGRGRTRMARRGPELQSPSSRSSSSSSSSNLEGSTTGTRKTRQSSSSPGSPDRPAIARLACQVSASLGERSTQMDFRDTVPKRTALVLEQMQVPPQRAVR